jgi:hypothetical protein
MSGWLLIGFIVAALLVGANPAAVIVTGIIVVGLSLVMDK